MYDEIVGSAIAGGVIASTFAYLKLKGEPLIPTVYGLLFGKKVFSKRKCDRLGIMGSNNLEKYLDAPREYVMILSNYLPVEVWDSGWIEWLKEGKQMGAKIRVISGPTISPYSKQTIFDLIKNNIIELRIFDKTPVQHFIVVDGKDAWIERSHIAPEAEDYFLVKGLHPDTRRMFEEGFDFLWKEAKEVKAEDVIQLRDQKDARVDPHPFHISIRCH